jgi:hypothetical protein
MRLIGTQGFSQVRESSAFERIKSIFGTMSSFASSLLDPDSAGASDRTIVATNETESAYTQFLANVWRSSKYGPEIALIAFRMGRINFEVFLRISLLEGIEHGTVTTNMASSVTDSEIFEAGNDKYLSIAAKQAIRSALASEAEVLEIVNFI